MNRKSFDTTVSEIPAMFPPVLGTANCTPYDMEQELSTSDELEDFEKISWHDRFLWPVYSGFSGKANVLHALKKVERFVWEDDQQAAFEYMKLALCEAPVLQIPDFQKEFVLMTDFILLSLVDRSGETL